MNEVKLATTLTDTSHRRHLNSLTVIMIRLKSNSGRAAGTESTAVESEYRCARCNESFPTKPLMIGHMTVNHNMSQYVAQRNNYECPTSGTELKGFNTHLLVKEKRRFSCSKCSNTYTKNYSLKKHLMNKHGFNGHENYKCEECGKTFAKLQSLAYHKLIHKPPQFTCSYCNRKFFTRTGVQIHLNAVHTSKKVTVFPHTKKSFPCQHCAQTCPTAVSLKHHLLKIHQPKELKCSHCHKEFATVTEHNNHLWKSHAVFVKQDFECKICHKMCKDKVGLVKHSQFHGNPTHSCFQCPLKFHAPNHLSHHVKRVHSVKFAMPAKTNNKEVNYICAVCCKPCGLRWDNLVSHLNYHYWRPQVCSICQQSFNAATTLKIHMREKHRHSRETIQCDICSKKFLTPERFLIHRRYHEKPTLTCSHCAQCFYTKVSLLNHEKSLNSKTKLSNKKSNVFGCSICLSEFPVRWLLKAHINTHNPLFSCSKCDYQCHGKAILNRHLCNFHAAQ